jgi:serine/threonine protein kinase
MSAPLVLFLPSAASCGLGGDAACPLTRDPCTLTAPRAVVVGHLRPRDYCCLLRLCCAGEFAPPTHACESCAGRSAIAARGAFALVRSVAGGGGSGRDQQARLGWLPLAWLRCVAAVPAAALSPLTAGAFLAPSAAPSLPLSRTIDAPSLERLSSTSSFAPVHGADADSQLAAFFGRGFGERAHKHRRRRDVAPHVPADPATATATLATPTESGGGGVAADPPSSVSSIASHPHCRSDSVLLSSSSLFVSPSRAAAPAASPPRAAPDFDALFRCKLSVLLLSSRDAAIGDVSGVGDVAASASPSGRPHNAAATAAAVAHFTAEHLSPITSEELRLPAAFLCPDSLADVAAAPDAVETPDDAFPDPAGGKALAFAAAAVPGSADVASAVAVPLTSACDVRHLVAFTGGAASMLGRGGSGFVLLGAVRATAVADAATDLAALRRRVAHHEALLEPPAAPPPSARAWLVAVKIVPLPAPSSSLVEHLRREIVVHALASGHPHLVRLFGVYPVLASRAWPAACAGFTASPHSMAALPPVAVCDGDRDVRVVAVALVFQWCDAGALDTVAGALVNVDAARALPRAPSPAPAAAAAVPTATAAVAAAAAHVAPLREHELAALLAPLASALRHLHEDLGISHRDLKPGNILLTSRGEVLVADLGIARRIDVAAAPIAAQPGASATASTDQRDSSLRARVLARTVKDHAARAHQPSPAPAAGSQVTLCGTPLFLAPELVAAMLGRGAPARDGGGGSGSPPPPPPEPDLRTTDVFALGVLLRSVMLPPPPRRAELTDAAFNAPDMPARADALLDASIGPESRAFVARMLSADPTARPRAQDLADAPLLRAYGLAPAASGVHAKRERADGAAASSAPPRRRACAVIAALCALSRRGGGGEAGDELRSLAALARSGEGATGGAAASPTPLRASRQASPERPRSASALRGAGNAATDAPQSSSSSSPSPSGINVSRSLSPSMAATTAPRPDDIARAASQSGASSVTVTVTAAESVALVELAGLQAGAGAADVFFRAATSQRRSAPHAIAR